jgi:hypothetical protein
MMTLQVLLSFFSDMPISCKEARREEEARRKMTG